MVKRESSDEKNDQGGLAPNWHDANVPPGFTLVAVGDLIQTEPLFPRMRRTSPELLELIQQADVAFGNFESTALDLERTAAYPEALSGGGWLISSSRVPADLAAMGFNLVSRANNHTTDWGVQGMRETNALFDAAGLAHAGTGETLAQARAARMLSISAGRIALVALASRFEANARAIDPLGQVPGRPGLNGLRTTRHAVVTPEQLQQLRVIRDSQPVGSVRRSVLEADTRNGTVTLFGAKYRASDAVVEAHAKLAFTFTVDERDRVEIIQAIRQAKQTSDFCVVSMHTHEPGNYSETPPDFMPAIAREAIDNGADAFVGHGPHQLRGIEIYKGRPIFYSLGNFFFMDNTWQPLARDEYEMAHVEPGSMTPAELVEQLRVEGVFKDSIWFESILAVSEFDARGRLQGLRLHPVELHWDGCRDADRGIPRTAPAEIGLRILQRLQRLCEAFSTAIEIRSGVGFIRIQND